MAVPNKNKFKDYLSVRVQLVHVKKGLFGFKDDELCKFSAIPDTKEESEEIFERIKKIVQEYGVTISEKVVG